MSQQIYIPLSGASPIPYEFDADTMMVPRGQSSVLWELRDGNLTAAEALIYLCLNHGSSWNSGATWSMSGPYLSKILGTGMSRSYVVKTLANLSDKGWIETIDEDNPSGNRYRLRHHLCDYEDMPVNRDGKPLKFAVPRGAGGPLERCFDSDISWKAALVWISLKLRSNWKAHADTAGQTESATLLELSKRCRISLPTYQNLITELTHAGMLERLTPKSNQRSFSCIPSPSRDLSSPAQRSNKRRLSGKSSKPMVSIGIPIIGNTGVTGKAARFKDGNAAAHGNASVIIINIKRCLKRSSVILTVLLTQSVLLSLQFFHKYIWDAIFLLILPC